MPEVALRPYADTDEAVVLDLLAASLGKTVDDRYRGFFRWKHLENPFGRSFMWVAEVDGVVAGFRAFLRWRFLDPGGDPVEAVRAVDTATHPDFRGKGLFRQLTLHGLDEMRPAGVQVVFNTPNDQSRPGYLKMGWVVDGRVPVRVRPRSPWSLRTMLQARTAAEPWSLPTGVGRPVGELDDAALGGTAASVRPGALVTDRSTELVRWRYGACPAVGSEAVPAGDGAVLVRFRRRGMAMECTVGDVVGTSDSRAAGAAARRALAAAGADYAIASASTRVGGFLPVPRLGPVQTRRQVGERPVTLPLALTLGDVELF